MVTAFATRSPYRDINYLDFHVQADMEVPEEPGRDAIGGDLFKCNFWTEGYDPVSEEASPIVPARQLMLAALACWMQDFLIDGIRLDNIKSIGNWDFTREFKDCAWNL